MLTEHEWHTVDPAFPASMLVNPMFSLLTRFFVWIVENYCYLFKPYDWRNPLDAA